MIYSLYTRVIMLFVFVVVMCFVFASLVMKNTYDEKRLELFHDQLIRDGHRVIAELSRMDSDTRQMRVVDLKGIGPNRYKLVPAKDTSIDVETVVRGEVKGLAVPNEVSVELPARLDGVDYTLIVEQRFDDIAGSFRSVLNVFQTGGYVFVILSSLAIATATVLIVRPIMRLVAAVNQIAAGNYKVTMNMNRRDELGVLARSIEAMSGQLQQIETMRQQFVSNVSHEIQSPLTSIKGYSAELANPDLTPETREHYAKIVTFECERLSRLTADLLKLASLDGEQSLFRPSVFNLDEQLRRVLISIEPLWSDKQLNLDVQLNVVQIKADADMLVQVWLNLLTNSVKFTSVGGTIRISLVQTGENAHVSVSDTGIGIPEEHLGRIFERFYKADPSRNRDTPGNGLGLSIVHRIVSLHGGRVQVRSEQGKGTEVTVTLPCNT